MTPEFLSGALEGLIGAVLLVLIVEAMVKSVRQLLATRRGR